MVFLSHSVNMVNSTDGFEMANSSCLAILCFETCVNPVRTSPVTENGGLAVV